MDATRRNILGGALALPIFAAPALASRMDTHTTDRAAWDAAEKRWRDADAASDAHEAGPLAEAYARYKRACKPAPSLSFTFGGVTYNPTSIDRIRRVVTDLPGVSQARHIQEEVIARYDGWEAEDKAISDRTGYTAEREESYRLGSLAAKAERALILTPAPDLAALAVKARMVLGCDPDECGNWYDALQADIDGLASNA
jgi:hypothetical protein